MTDEYLAEDNKSCVTTTTTTNRKNNQNTFSWSSTSSSFSNSTLLTQEDNAQEDQVSSSLYLILLDEFFDLPDNDKKEKKLSQVLGRAASHGDIHTVRQINMNERLRPYLNLDASDDEENDGSTPLIYASCFGKLEIVKYLLQVGAKVDVQDKIGWTALMWATTNGHHQIVQVLLEYSASSETKSASGRTIYDLVNVENENMIMLLNQVKPPPETQQRLQLQPLPLPQPLQQSHSQAQSQPQPQPQQEPQPPIITVSEKELLHCQESFRSVHKFSWDQCLPDQMFVFAQENVDHILNVAISNLKLPIKSKSEIYVPANIMFLSARFAHYFTTRELVHELLSKAVQKITRVIKSNANDIHTLAFWITNLSQLLYYLKKDFGLVVVTAEHQLEIAELISEAYALLVLDSEERMHHIVEPALIEFEQIDGLEEVDFADNWHRFFRRGSKSNRRSMPSSLLPQQEMTATLSPQSIASLMTSILYVLQSYSVHPVIVIQAMAQLFHFLSCEVFNRILFNKKHLCRSKALQIRMNLTVIEEWVREHHLPTTLGAYFNPVVQLLQLLQCVSQLTDLMVFIDTVKAFDLLNPMQVKRLVLNYRYEVTEPKLPEEIEKYSMQIAQDTLKSLQSENQQQDKRPKSISSLGSLLLYSKSQSNKTNRLSVQSLDRHNCGGGSHYSGDVDEDDSREWIIEKRDPKSMLPFSLPTTTNMDQPHLQERSSSDSSIYFELKREKGGIVPSIPEDWLERLDHHKGQY